MIFASAILVNHEDHEGDTKIMEIMRKSAEAFDSTSQSIYFHLRALRGLCITNELRKNVKTTIGLTQHIKGVSSVANGGCPADRGGGFGLYHKALRQGLPGGGSGLRILFTMLLRA
jgi:hypothetical protein